MAGLNMANMALDGGDPRLADSNEKVTTQYALDHGHEGTFNIQAALVHNDPSVLFEEYLHYSKITRDAESHYESGIMRIKGMWNPIGIIKNRFSSGHKHQEGTTGDADKAVVVGNHQDFSTVTDAEWRTASRAARTAGWGTIFFIITTDILGPTGAAWAFSNNGYGPGVALYTVFGFLAAVSGWYFWGVYMHLDSDRYPIRDMGQAFFRVYGQGVRHMINILQSLQMFMLVAVLVLGLGSSISQISVGDNPPAGTNGLCYAVCMLIIALLGMVLGQIRTLQRFGWLANFSVATTVTAAFIAIIVSATSGPNYKTQWGNFGSSTAVPFGATNFPCGSYTCPEPIKTFAGTPPYGYASGGVGFKGALQGINSIVYSYGGAMLFFNLLAEMRNPWDFWKGMLCADLFIYIAYMMFGLVQYSYQGQYTYATNFQSINPYNYQTAGNILNIIGGLIAAALYGNIGIKVIYNNVFMEIFNFPALTEKKGKWLWVAFVPVYWALAYVVAVAIPNFGDLVSLVGAFCIGNFTYAFPAMCKIGFDVKKAAMLPDEYFDETTKKYIRLDGGMKRWIRGYKKTWMLTSFNIFYMLGGFTLCGLGCYAAIEGLISAFADGGSRATSFKCASPFGT